MAFVKFMRNKFFHPHTFENQKRTWIAEQNAEAEKKKQEDLHKTYIKEQAIYENKNLLRTGKLTQDDKLAFMYEPPLECRKKDEKLELREVRFEWQKNAPRTGDYARNLEVNDCPFGIEVRNTKCIKCSVWGHMNTDKICPLYNQGMHNDENPSELGKEDPMVLLKQMESGGLKMRKHAVNSVMDVASNKYKLLEADKVDPEVAFIANLTDKQKRKLMKKLNKSSLGVGGAYKAKSKKRKKEKKKKREKKTKDDNDDHPSSSCPLSQDNKDNEEIKFPSNDFHPSRRSGPQPSQRSDDPSPIQRKRHDTDDDNPISNQQSERRGTDEHRWHDRQNASRRRHDSDRKEDSRKRHTSRDDDGSKKCHESDARWQHHDSDRHHEERRPRRNNSKTSPVKRSTKGKEVVQRGSDKKDERRGSDRYDRKEHTVETRSTRKLSNSDSRNRRSSPKQVRRKESNSSNIKSSQSYRSCSSSSLLRSPTKEKKKTAKSSDRKVQSSSSSNSSRSPSPVKNSSKKSREDKSKRRHNESESSSSSDEYVKKSRRKKQSN